MREKVGLGLGVGYRSQIPRRNRFVAFLNLLESSRRVLIPSLSRAVSRFLVFLAASPPHWGFMAALQACFCCCVLYFSLVLFRTSLSDFLVLSLRLLAVMY